MAAAVASLSLAAAAGAGESEDPALTDLIQILRERGVIDDAQYTELATKAEKKQQGESWADRFEFGGNLRLRYEGFWFEEDPFGSATAGEDRFDRHRGRYRLRLQGKGRINDHAQVIFRLSTGGDDSRSSNQSFGANGINFDDDVISIDRAYAVLTPFANGEIPGREGWWGFEVGKVPIPFTWSKGFDNLLWDSDMNPEGAQMKWMRQVTDAFGYFANSAVYILDENSGAKDPKMAAAQLGAHVTATDQVKMGGRLTWYRFWDWNATSFTAAATGTAGGGSTSGGGNVVANLTGFENDFDVMSTTAYVDLDFIEDWPMRIYGNYARNLDAVSIAGGDDEDTAWSVGGELGDKKKYAKLGFLWGHLEANAFPSFLTDSDWWDGFTNREGFRALVERQILANTDFQVVLFKSTEIKDGPVFVDSLSGADRWRAQFNLIMKFGSHGS